MKHIARLPLPYPPPPLDIAPVHLTFLLRRSILLIQTNIYTSTLKPNFGERSHCIACNALKDLMHCLYPLFELFPSPELL